MSCCNPQTQETGLQLIQEEHRCGWGVEEERQE